MKRRPKKYEKHADFIRDFIWDTGLNIKATSRELGISHQTIYNYLYGSAMNVDYVELILNTMGYKLVIDDMTEEEIDAFTRLSEQGFEDD